MLKKLRILKAQCTDVLQPKQAHNWHVDVTVVNCQGLNHFPFSTSCVGIVCVVLCVTEDISHYFLPDDGGGGGGANWKGECPIKPIMGWGGLNCWAIRGWGPDEGGGTCPTAPPPDPELPLELLY